MKLVREHINERMRFTEDSDPIHDMGIGSKLGIFIDKLDVIAKTFEFQKVDDIAPYQSEDWEKTRVLAVWNRHEVERLKLFNDKTDDIEDDNEYWVSYDSEYEGGQNKATMWLKPKRWHEIF